MAHVDGDTTGIMNMMEKETRKQQITSRFRQVMRLW